MRKKQNQENVTMLHDNCCPVQRQGDEKIMRQGLVTRTN